MRLITTQNHKEIIEMKNIKHTPGPWKTTNEKYADSITILAQGKLFGRTIAIVPSLGESENGYNADLIARAPDLLAENERLCSAYGTIVADLGEKIAELEHSLSICATTLETVYRERDPKNIAAKCAAELARKVLSKDQPRDLSAITHRI
jgi:hypothetical protein